MVTHLICLRHQPSHVSLTPLEKKLTECPYAEDDCVPADQNETWKFDINSQISNATHISSLRTPKTPRRREEEVINIAVKRNLTLERHGTLPVDNYVTI